MTEAPGDFDVVNVPWTWVDAFPWLASKAGGWVRAGDAWWDHPIQDATGGARDEIIEDIASLAIEQMGKWPIGEVLPGLPADVNLAALNLSARALNVFQRENKLVTGDLLDLSVDDLLEFRNAGLGTVTAVLGRFAELSTSVEQVKLALPDERKDVVEAPSEWMTQLLRDLETLAEWNRSIGHPERGVLAELPIGTPGVVAQARERVVSLSAAEVAPAGHTSIGELLDSFIGGMEERSRVVLATRLFPWQRKTLDELGHEFGVTRERIRQIEVRARSKLGEFASADNPVGRVAALARGGVRGVRPLTELLEEAPALAEIVNTVGQPVWRIFDVLDESYEIADGWCVEPSFEAVRGDTAVFLSELADDYGVIRLADVALPGSDEVHAQTWFKDWLEYLHYEIRESCVLLRTRSINDVAAAVLSIEGAPLTVEELHAKIGRGSPNSLKNQLYTDPVFHRIDLERWALASWGMDAYSNIRDEIGKLLEQAGGELALAAITESLVERFGVAANSVTIYASSAPYELKNGIVRKQTNALAGAGKNPAKVQFYYRRGDDWLYRTSVTHDHLRGSGWAASTALATILGMSPGQYVELPSRLGNQKFSYSAPQPAYGSIRRFLEDMDLGIGDEIFLVLKGDGSFDVELLPPPATEKLAEALRLVGADMTLPLDQATAALGAAIKFAAGADLSEIAAGFKARGEELIHDLILGAETGG